MIAITFSDSFAFTFIPVPQIGVGAAARRTERRFTP
ncbi:hypothetical protein SAMN05216279_11473 [Pseudomonas oryzihabitans]|uniref:Uncharacterized protein n=1 Tax=Pseudomonas oryzihabitans TaxID=47885 RepID=A0A1G5PEY4_9PSED|nr:hypothetical protein SAMN05216279_11473 [Pseudomonas psychrotolerans]